MPTPFTHLAKAQQLIEDPQLSEKEKTFLSRYWGAFLLGNIVPDAHHMVMSSVVNRYATHFFQYGPKIDPLAEARMLQLHPELHFAAISDPEHVAFVAGYLAHLAVDEMWAVEVVNRFYTEAWLDAQRRHFAFSALLAVMDGRDYAKIPENTYLILREVQPQDWLAFLPDYAIVAWRNRIARQIAPDGEPETLIILGRTVYSGYENLYDMVNSSQRLQDELWQYFSEEKAREKEQLAYEHMRHVVKSYLNV